MQLKMPNIVSSSRLFNLFNLSILMLATLLILIATSQKAWSTPQIKIEKSIVGNNQQVSFGSDVIFQIKVINIGDQLITNVYVLDNYAPDCGGYLSSNGHNQDGLDPGSSFTYQCKVKNVQYGFINKAFAFGQYDNGSQCLAGTIGRRSNSLTLQVNNQPQIDIRKQEEGNDVRTVPAGSDVDYEIAVTNTGDLALTDVQVSDPTITSCDRVIGSLAVGETQTYVCTAPAVFTSFNNTATAFGRTTLIGNNPRDCDVSDADRSKVLVDDAECAISVTKQANPSTLISQPPLSCDTIEGRPTRLTFKLTGGGCASSDNDQGDRSDCSGAMTPGALVNISAGSQDFKNLYSVSNTSVLPGDTFSISGNFDANSALELSNSGGIELNLFHTSCSRPLATGDVFGSLTLVGINNQSGQDGDVIYSYVVTNLGDAVQVTVTDDKLGPVPDAAQNVFQLNRDESKAFSVLTQLTQTTTNIVTVSGMLVGPSPISCMTQASATVTVEEPPKTCASGKPTTLVLEYTGQSCAASANDQGGKTTCDGDPAGATPIQLVMTKDSDKISVTPASQTVNIGDLITISRNDGNRFASTTEFDLVQGANVLQSLNIHTSCSVPLVVGDQYGSMVLRDFTPEQ